ncbi:MAG TPA: hypothetical protein VM680_18745 [Verrucomicrobiae bacterium]|nr:hypothetical protein [Verrucomicrobiae bacterium]
MMFRFVLILLACVAAPSWGQRIDTYYNRSSVSNQVVIADHFINDGFFEVQNLLLNTNSTTYFSISTTPYDFSATKTYLNNGTIRGTSIRFDNVDKYGNRTPSDSFANTGSGRVDFADGFHFGTFPIFQEFIRGVWSSPFSSIRVNARDISNQGLMRIGAGGLLRLGHTNQVDGSLTADRIDVSSGLLVVDPLGFAYGDTVLTTYDNYFRVSGSYLNDLGVFDVAWGMGSFTNQNQQFFVTGSNPAIVNVPEHRLTNAFGSRFISAFSMLAQQSFAYTFTRDVTNIYVQAVYVGTSDTNVIADARWLPFAYLPNDILADPRDFHTAIVQLSSVMTNALTLQVETNTFYIADQLGSAATNFTIVPNDRYPGYFRPAPYFISRGEPVEFFNGFTSNTLATPNLFFPGYSNIVVTNAYAAYVFDLENLAYAVPAVPDASAFDLPGRVEILGESVNLGGTGIRGEGLISITANQIETTDRTVIDAQNLAFNLSYTNAAAPTTPLRIQNLAKDQTARLHGQVYLWSGTFTNQFGDANSNVFNVFYHVTVVDATALSSIQEVSVADFRVRTADLRIDDNMIVSNRFDVSSSSVTIAGNVELRNTLWGTNLPNLVNLTVEPTGNLRLVGLADFGTTARPLQNFVNQGSISAYSQSIVADNVEVTGDMFSGQNVVGLFVTQFGGLVFSNFFQIDAGPLFVTANQSARFTDADILTHGDVTMSGPVFKFDQTRIDSGAAINFNVTGALIDSGPNAGNVFASSNYFALNTTIGAGSMLGTTIIAEPPPRGTYRFRWSQPVNSDPSITNIPLGSVDAWIAATNRAYAAYTTNMGIGHIVLNTGTNTVFEFSGTSPGRALYVDLLEFTGTGITNLASLTNQLRLVANSSSSIDIYYADIRATNFQQNLGFQSLAEALNGKRLGGGRLFWVGTFNGPNTSEDVVIRGTSVPMNTALRRSQIIDMDLDGIANGNDDLPFQSGVSALTISSINLSQVEGKVTVNFIAFPGTYQVQYTESMETAVWKTANTYTKSGTTGSAASVSDPNPPSDKPRFYRLIYQPASGAGN